MSTTTTEQGLSKELETVELTKQTPFQETQIVETTVDKIDNKINKLKSQHSRVSLCAEKLKIQSDKQTVELTATYYNAWIIMKAYGLENYLSKCDKIAINVLFCLLLVVQIGGLAILLFSNDGVSSLNGKNDLPHALEHNDFFLEPVNYTQEYQNCTCDVFSQKFTGRGDIKGKDKSGKADISTLFMQTIALTVFIIYSFRFMGDRSAYRELISHVLSFYELRNVDIKMALTIRYVTTLFAWIVGSYKTIREDDAFDIFANVLAITFLLEVDEWLYVIIQRFIDPLNDELFSIEFNPNEFVNEKIKKTYFHTKTNYAFGGSEVMDFTINLILFIIFVLGFTLAFGGREYAGMAIMSVCAMIGLILYIYAACFVHKVTKKIVSTDNINETQNDEIR